MEEDTLERIRKDVRAYRRDHADPPGAITLHPATWYELVRATRDRRMTFTDAPVPRPTLFGMEVVEDPSLAPGTWRLVR